MESVYIYIYRIPERARSYLLRFHQVDLQDNSD